MKLWVDSVLLEKQYFNNRLVSWHFLLFPVYFVCVKSSVLADCFNKYHSCLQVLLKLMSLKVALPKVSNLQFVYSQGSIWFFFLKGCVLLDESEMLLSHIYSTAAHQSFERKRNKTIPNTPHQRRIYLSSKRSTLWWRIHTFQNHRKFLGFHILACCFCQLHWDQLECIWPKKKSVTKKLLQTTLRMSIIKAICTQSTLTKIKNIGRY